MKTTPRFPRFRALVRALTSPRRVWFWTTTLPLLLAPVLLYLVMRPGVRIQWSQSLGGLRADVFREDHVYQEVRPRGERALLVWIFWPGGRAVGVCRVARVGRPAVSFFPEPHWIGPVGWRSDPGNTTLALNARLFELEGHLSY